MNYIITGIILSFLWMIYEYRKAPLILNNKESEGSEWTEDSAHTEQEF